MTALDSSSLKFWESVAEWGFRMVFIGVAGEGAEIIAKLFFKKSFKKHEHSWDIFSGICWLILVVGLAIEFKGTHNVTQLSDSENARLTDEAARLNKEAADARLETAKLEQQIEQTKINLANINPLNLPIVLATAEVGIFIVGTNSLQGWRPPQNEVESDVNKLFVRLMFKDPDVGDFPVFLECERIQKMDSPAGTDSGFLILNLSFKSDSLGSEWRTDKQSEKWDNFSAKKFDEFKEAEISIYGLLDKAEIRMGTCSVTLNSTIKRNFSIASQSAKDKIVLRSMNNKSDAAGEKQR